MSFASHYKRKVIEDQNAAASVNQNVIHAWCHMWLVEHSMEIGAMSDVPMFFNPVTNLHNARLDDSTLAALSNVAKHNRVYETKIKLCTLPCSLMVNRPRWQLIRDPALAHCTICEECAHNMQHHYNVYMEAPPDRQAEFVKAIEQLNPGCTVNAHGAIVFKEPIR